MKLDMFGVFETVNGGTPVLRTAFASKNIAEQYAKSIGTLKHSIDSNATMTTSVQKIEVNYNPPKKEPANESTSQR